MTDDEILALAHRMAWRYKMSSDKNNSDTYTFNDRCIIQFATEISKESYIRGSNDCHKSMLEMNSRKVNKCM